MSYFIILLSFLFAMQVQPTDPEPNGLTIGATGKIELPANQIQFRINVNAEADNPQDAYELHQEREKALVQLLDKYNIEEKNIGYEPMSISKIRNYDREPEAKPVYRTQQTVNVLLQDFSAYEKIQVGLIQNGFDDFSGNFSNTDMEAGKDKALRRAITKAREKAEIIAEETGVNLGDIIEISYNFNDVQPYAQETAQLRAASNDGSLLKYNQTVTVSAHISIRYAI